MCVLRFGYVGFELFFLFLSLFSFSLLVFFNLVQLLYHVHAFENEDFLLDYYSQSKITFKVNGLYNLH